MQVFWILLFLTRISVKNLNPPKSGKIKKRTEQTITTFVRLPVGMLDRSIHRWCNDWKWKQMSQWVRGLHWFESRLVCWLMYYLSRSYLVLVTAVALLLVKMPWSCALAINLVNIVLVTIFSQVYESSLICCRGKAVHYKFTDLPMVVRLALSAAKVLMSDDDHITLAYFSPYPFFWFFISFSTAYA